MPKPTKYRGGSYTRTPAGHYQAKIYHAYRRIVKTLPTERAARAWLDDATRAIEDAQTPLTTAQADDARAALALLPEGVTLAAAADHYRRTTLDAPDPIPLQDALDHYRSAKTARNLKDTSLEALDFHTARFLRDHPGAILQQFTPIALLDWLDTLDLQPTNRANHIRYLRAFFRWCVKARLLSVDPTDPLELPRADQTLPGILAVHEAGALLRAAQQHAPQLLPYLPLALFAGLRQSELMKITWTDLLHPDRPGLIHVGPNVAKTRQQRYTTIPPNLAAWLVLSQGLSQARLPARGTVPSPPSQGHPARGTVPHPPDPILPAHLATDRKRLAAALQSLRRAAGIPWPRNCLRHSYATYHLALYADAPRTAHELGHQSPGQLYRDYRNLATHAQAQAYFSLLPDPSSP